MNKVTVQEQFLNYVISNQIPVKLITKNGVPISGVITSFDQYTIMIQTPVKQSLVNKAAVSTIIPAKPVRFAKHNKQ